MRRWLGETLIMCGFAFFLVSALLVCAGYCFFQHECLLPGFRIPDDSDMDFFSPELLSTHEMMLPCGLHALAFLARHNHRKGVVVFFHGNKGTVYDYAGSMFPECLRRGYDLVMVEYPGFGKSREPLPRDERTFLRSVDAAYCEIARKTDVVGVSLPHYKDIVLVGYSMGTSAASFIASRHTVAAVLLISPFYSLQHLSRLSASEWIRDHSALTSLLERSVQWRLPIGDFCARITSSTHVCIVHGKHDTTTHAESADLILARIPHENKSLFMCPNSDHVSIYRSPYLAAAIDAVLLKKKAE